MFDQLLACLFFFRHFLEIFNRHAGTSSAFACHCSICLTAPWTVSFPATWLSTTATGARPHEPTQRAETSEIFPSGVVSPNLVLQQCSTAFWTSAAPLT